jgi:long-chain acyl-CoA synthetase
VSIQPSGEANPTTAGRPCAGIEVRIADRGEVLVRGGMVFRGYLKNDEATREVIDAEGWFHTGDAGFIDPRGHLVIIDRAKDVSRLADGTMFAPKFIENKLKFSPYVREAVCIGQARPCVTAFINIDLAAVGSWAERRNIAYTSYGDIAQKPEVYELIRGEVERVNASLAADDVLRGAQVRRFLILHKELDPDDEEITRTRKVRRGYIAQKYAALIDALYSGQDRVQVEAKVTYEDGRTGTMRADVVIRDVGTPLPVAR